MFENLQSIDFESLLRQWLPYVQNPFVLVQAGLVILAIALARYGTRLIDKRTPTIRREPESPKTSWYVRKFFRQYVLTLMTPLLAVIFLGLISQTTASWVPERTLNVVHIASRLALLWLGIRTIRTVIDNLLIKKIISAILYPAAVLYVVGLLDETKAFLDSVGFTMNEVNFSLLVLIKGVLALAILIWVGRLVATGFENVIKKQSGLNSSLKTLFIKLFNIVLATTLIIVAMNFLGIDLTALAVFSGALGVGLGFGLQKITSNFVSGIILLLENSVRENDMMELEDGTFGKVKNLGARATLIETVDGLEVLIPNEDFIVKPTTNWT